MSRLHIPRLGTEIIVAEDWTFQLFDEHRNEGLRTAAGITRVFDLLPNFWQARQEERINTVSRTKWRMSDGTLPEESHDYHRMCHPLTMPRLATLSIDRIFIRKGAADFDSVTFWLKAKQNPVAINGRTIKKSVRFWAKLDDVNRIEVWEPTP
ncbi:hypothetical protein AB6809_29685 [Paraburkholderia sp. RCC_158]|uniref:hypothetical protein n=1 Tax=Paraburkholderia sp. RCC_158 TaxID=3239220 RepID=UPI0035269D05